MTVLLVQRFTQVVSLLKCHGFQMLNSKSLLILVNKSQLTPGIDEILYIARCDNRQKGIKQHGYKTNLYSNLNQFIAYTINN